MQVAVHFIKCYGQAGEWLGDLELADSAGDSTIHVDESDGGLSISEGASYALLLHRSADYSVRFAAPISSERVGSGDPFGQLRSHIGLGAISLGFDKVDGQPLWRRLVQIRPSKFKDLVEFETMVAEISDLTISLALDLQGKTSASWVSVDLDHVRAPEEELAVLRFAIESERLLEAIGVVARNAHARLERDDNPARLGEGTIDPSRIALSLSGAGPRAAVPDHHPLRAVLGSLPLETPSGRRVESNDTPANRFTKFVARSFRDRLGLALGRPQKPLAALMQS